MDQEEKKAATDVPTIMRPNAAATYVGVSASKLAKLRMRDHRLLGPKFSKIAGCIVYRKEDLDAWVEDNVVVPDEVE